MPDRVDAIKLIRESVVNHGERVGWRKCDERLDLSVHVVAVSSELEEKLTLFGKNKIDSGSSMCQYIDWYRLKIKITNL